MLLPYDPRWAGYFEEAKLPLSQALGHYALDIQHVGSTSIPGISAKPVVDIAIAIEHYPLPDEVLEAVKALGYTYWGEYGIPHRHLFFTREGPVGYNVHINELANDQFQRHILFRDYLRAYPAAVREYEDLKRELASRFDEVGPYAESKSEFVRDILAKARAWQGAG
jgi:GrpB-like predicted nucleotidyltransferase (UPF0157 family)